MHTHTHTYTRTHLHRGGEMGWLVGWLAVVVRKISTLHGDGKRERLETNGGIDRRREGGTALLKEFFTVLTCLSLILDPLLNGGDPSPFYKQNARI